MESANKMNAGSESGLQMSYLITYTNVNGWHMNDLLDFSFDYAIYFEKFP